MSVIENLLSGLPPAPPLADTEQAGSLRQRLRALLAGAGYPERLLRGSGTSVDSDQELLRQLAADPDLATFAVSGPRAGRGSDRDGIAVCLEESGSALAPVPYLTSGVVAAQVLLRHPDVAGDILPGLRPEHRVGALAVTAANLPYGPFPRAVTGEVAGAEFRLQGSVPGVLGGREAGFFIVPALLSTTPALVMVPPEAGAQVQRTPVTSLDETRPLTDVRFAGAPGAVLCTGEQAAHTLQRALIAGVACLALEQAGLARECLERTVAYVKRRYQFGRQIGSFQAIKHRLADLWVKVLSAEATARFAAWNSRSDAEAAAATAAVAKIHCSRVAVRAAEERIQLHGGLGVTWQNPAHLYLKRAMAQSLLFGTPVEHEEWLADYLSQRSQPGQV